MLIRTTLCLLFISLIAACEGGKSSPSCGPNETRQNNRCVSTQNPDNQCPVGQDFIEGRCRDIDQSCGTGFHSENGQCVSNQLSVDIISNTSCLKDGSTRVLLQYIVRDPDGRPITVSAAGSESQALLKTEVLVDGNLLSSESRIERDAELLNSDLALSLVLDASYSMLVEHTPPAFTPMKNAATTVLSNAKDAWMANDSQFYWELSWFDRNIYTPDEDRGRPWTTEDIANIPEPESGGATVLFKAVSSMMKTHQSLYNNGLAAGERDQHIMLIFSDGEDNNSDFDTSNQEPELGGEADALAWVEKGYKDTALSQLQNQLASSGVPNLRLLVIGFGDKADEQTLQSLAELGNGRYFFGDNANTLDQIFAEVQKEFATLQTIEIETPLPQKAYTFALHALETDSGDEGRSEFTVDVSALNQCPQ